MIEAADGAFDPRAIYDKAGPGVVTVRSVFEGGGGGLLGGGGAGLGSGFVLNDEGEIVTNAHVVTNGQATGGSGELKPAKEVFVEFLDRNQVPAEVVGFDPHADVALLKVDPDGLDLSPLGLGRAGEVEVGDAVAAIGSPFGEEQSLSVGVVSATDRSVRSLTDFQIDGAIQTDASINPGNSGGPMLDADGRVVGINQQIDTTSGANEGVGFAVPIDLVRRSVVQLRSAGEPRYAFIGVSTQALYPQLAERLEIDSPTGALIVRVVPNGPADEAGLRGGEEMTRFQAQELEAGGDVILSVDDEDVVAESDLARIISTHEAGETVTLAVLRDGKRESIEVELGARPDELDES